MEKNQIERIYVVRDEDQEHHKYISQILIEFANKNVKYYSLSPSDLKKSSKKVEKAEQKMDDQLKKVLKGLEREDYKKVIFVKDSDQLLRRHVDRTIEIKQSKKLKKDEDYSQIALGISTLTSLGMILSPVHGPINIFFNSVAASAISLNAMLTNSKRKKMPKVEPEWVRKLRFSLSVAFLAINVGLGAKNLSIELKDTFPQKTEYSLHKGFNSQDKQPVLDSSENPFEDGNMITSADLAVNLLMEAFNLNPYLEEGDRQIAQSLRQYIKENPYFNYEKCYDDFSSFELITTNVTKGNIGGINNSERITIYGLNQLEYKEYVDKLEHELIHYTGNLDNGFLNEGMTTLICSEYMDDFELAANYYDQVLGTKILCELITPEKMLEAYSKEDMGIIEEELAKINPEKYRELLNVMDEYHSKMRSAAYKGEIESFLAKESPQFKEDFSNLILDFTENLSEDKIERIVIYLNAIGQQMNSKGAIYFNKSVNQPGFVKVYHTEADSLNLETGYSY